MVSQSPYLCAFVFEATRNMELATLKRPELQKLAKKHGIKANQKNEKLVKLLEEVINCQKSDSGFLQEEQITPLKVSKRGRPKKTNKTAERGDCSLSAESNLSKGMEDSLMSDIYSTDVSKNTSSIISISPKWNELDCNDLMDLSNESAPLTETRQGRDTNQAKGNVRTRSSSRNRQDSTPKVQETKPVANITTPKDTKQVNGGKTFSIPKKRTTVKIENKENSRVSAVMKRRSSEKANVTQAKKTRDSAKWKKDMKDAVLSSVEQKLGRPSQLRKSASNSTVMFAAKGVSVGKIQSSASKGMFTKTHKKGFGKLESIDDYQKRKTERAEMLLGSGRKRDVLSRLSKPKTPNTKIVRPNILTPVNNRKVTQNRKSSTLKPTVNLSMGINTNFGRKSSKLVTPKKVAVTFAKTPTKVAITKTPAERTKRPSRVSLTPFKSNLPSTPASTRKNFDLQESLKKPLKYVPHKGPLKKYEDPAKTSLQERFKKAKNPKITTRDKRRQDREKMRSNTKSSLMMKRRGIK
uniref:Nucleolar and spindle-associated protein 1-like n=1 Tax=Phallusia mammillata TaxID=59560 RepID=A0A6F9DM74_9ASCI|nr:nucleolar and spindle-associated protein 1-like [Phallusia mammillata]